jgi:hypothetical protein
MTANGAIPRASSERRAHAHPQPSTTTGAPSAGRTRSSAAATFAALAAPVQARTRACRNLRLHRRDPDSAREVGFECELDMSDAHDRHSRRSLDDLQPPSRDDPVGMDALA